MQWTQLHLALNHLPVMGVPFLLALMMWGMFRRSAEILRLSHGWMVLLCALSIALKFTGDFAADEGKERLSGSKVWVERHEQSADQATTGLFLLGVSSAVGWVVGRRRASVPSWANWTSLSFGVMTGILLGRAAHFGGQISHPDLRVEGAREVEERVAMCGGGVIPRTHPRFGKTRSGARLCRVGRDQPQQRNGVS